MGKTRAECSQNAYTSAFLSHWIQILANSSPKSDIKKKKKKKQPPTLFVRILRSVGRGQHNNFFFGLMKSMAWWQKWMKGRAKLLLLKWFEEPVCSGDERAPSLKRIAIRIYTCGGWPWIMSSGESQKDVNTVQRWSVENQKGIVQSQWR